MISPKLPATMGLRCKALRTSLKMTQKEVALKASISQPSYSVIESGDTKVNEVKATTVLALAKTLRTSPDYLLGLTSDPAAIVNLTAQQNDVLSMFGQMTQPMRESCLLFMRALVAAHK